MLKIRRPLGRLIFNMGIAIPGKTVFLIETAPRWFETPSWSLWRHCNVLALRDFAIHCGLITLYGDLGHHWLREWLVAPSHYLNLRAISHRVPKRGAYGGNGRNGISTKFNSRRYIDVIMSAIASQIVSVPIVYWAVCSGADQRKHQSSASLALVRGIHRWTVNSPHKGPVTRKMYPFDDVIMNKWSYLPGVANKNVEFRWQWVVNRYQVTKLVIIQSCIQGHSLPHSNDRRR